MINKAYKIYVIHDKNSIISTKTVKKLMTDNITKEEEEKTELTIQAYEVSGNIKIAEMKS